MNETIYFFTKYSRLGASSRYRTFQYLSTLPSNVDYEVHPLFNDGYIEALYQNNAKPIFKALLSYIKRFFLLLKCKSNSTLVLENELWPYLPFFIEKLFLKRFNRLVLIYDDAIFHHYDLSNNFYLKLNKKKIGELIGLSSCTIAGNKYLESYALTYNKPVTVIPTVIDIKKYKLQEKLEPTQNEKLQLVWLGSPSTARYLYLLKDVFENPLVRENCQLIIIGTSNIHIDGLDTTYLDWSEETEINNIQKCDVGIMPLNDDPWSRGKCGFKLIQYMAAGLPCIASPVGINKEIITDGVTGFLADGAPEWVDSIKTFLNDRNLIKQLGKAGRDKIEKFYTIDATKEQWLDSIIGKT
ncbi:MAG: glycosyltransferase family 4 protein [Candidatus Caenarcaniphilales bacterium]|nr:glycosyltransferase family 4 protein [Candidatus Caenarcaniphilales bacterium]